MKRKILIGGIAAVTLLSATTASAFAGKTPGPAPAQVTRPSPGKAHTVTGATVQAVPSNGTPHAVPKPVLVRPVKGHASVALQAGPTGTAQPVPAQVKAAPAKK
ncbi:MAG: hypothetical protein QOH03_4928 [Kribbellaceae bacterium]|nr:hypothetical protein [Kribbellaceae bacterium]